MTERAPRQKTRGFSIMELLIVVAIVLIIAAVAIPNFQKVMAEIRLRSSASAVAGVIQQARIRSVRDNKIYSVAIDTSVTPNMVFVDLNNSGAFNGQEPNGTSEHKLSPGDRLTAVAELPALERLLRREPVPGGPDGSAATG